jgi:diamine N-acetyltransferase
LGILVDASSRKKGVALSAMNLLIEYAFKFLKLHQVYAHISADNKASIALFKSLGFKQSGILSEWVTSSNSRYEDVLIFQMINPEKTERLSLSRDLSDK